MRARLLVVLVTVVLAAVAGFAFPLLGTTAEQRTQQLVIARNADVDRFVVLAQQASDSADAAALAAEARRYAEVYSESVLVIDARRRVLASAGGLSLAQSDVSTRVEAALRNEAGPAVAPLRPWSHEPVLFARPVGSGTRVAGVVLLRASVARAANDVATWWAAIGAGALLAAMVFVVLAVLLARWVLRPLHELEGGVRAVSEGRHADLPATAGPRELRSLTTAFNRMSDAVVSASEQQRRLVADASHQLRNPMAALRLRMDSLAPSVGEPGQRGYHAAVAEVDRLESLLDGLLTLAIADSTATRLAAGDHAEEPSALETVAAERIDAWLPAAERAKIRLTGESGPAALVRCPESELAQILDVLLDNAIAYAGEDAEIRVRWTVGDGTATLTVSDTGPGLTDDEISLATQRFWRARREGAPRGTGLGLTIAHRQVGSRGGTLELRRADPRGLAALVTLPLAREDRS
ncbi:HAMP domain-containing sensor histidine kinase [Amycolatopsis minnesotensis]|uniref:histidine kinase n=1 Tax=Amycolatopsis minnesotensis TaxID=337894 RepID=A0ABP5DDY6_9PSEU